MSAGALSPTLGPLSSAYRLGGDGTRSPGAPSRKARAALPLPTVGAGMLVHLVSVAPADVVFVKGLVEASDGLAGVFAERGGELMVAAPHDREREVIAFLDDLRRDVRAIVTSAIARTEDER
jgi:hypothetical protein